MTPSPHTIRHLTGNRRSMGRPPEAVYRAVTRHDGRATTLADAIRDTVGFDTVAAALGIAPQSLRKNIVYGTRGVRPADARAIAQMVKRPLGTIFIDTRITEA